MQVPYFRPDIGEDDIQAVAGVLRSGWLTTGPVNKQFESEFCRATGAQHAVAVSSGTTGLHAALIAAGINIGDEVITTPLTFCGTIRSIEETGAKPVFVDIGDDLNLDAELIADAITPRTRAILPVHLAGLPCDMDVIEQQARRHGHEIVEDAAHAFGAAWRGQPVGSNEHSTAVFSFYANKNLTSGEGGMITTSDSNRAAHLRRVIAFGLQRASERADNRWQYEVVERGFKYNMSDVLAALGAAQLKKAARHAEQRREVVRDYTHGLSHIDEIELPHTHSDRSHAWHLYIIRLHLDQLTVTRDEFVALLAERGVGCSVHFRPIPMHSWFAHYGPMDLWPKTQREFPRLVSLPIYPGLSEEQREYVITQLQEVVATCRKRPVVLTARALA
ncbi:MAG: DegT/DnrJ/EryC1/StrS aminotransferase family protein [Acidobacteriaceae bacterium]|nr:DegT/DnrJ/EryC1/StrS aminotransferase family protein [Acidobacteriaceae bacterium]